MTGKKLSFLARAVKILMLVIPNLISLSCDITSLASLEARLARKTLVTLIILGVFMGLVLATTWLCVLCLLALYIFSLQGSLMFSIFLILILNILILVIIGLIIQKLKNRLLFPATTHRISKLLP